MELVLFSIQARPNFWPQIENRLWVVLALNKKTPFFVFRDHESHTICELRFFKGGHGVNGGAVAQFLL